MLDCVVNTAHSLGSTKLHLKYDAHHNWNSKSYESKGQYVQQDCLYVHCWFGFFHFYI
jgi:hypothetical protein